MATVIKIKSSSEAGKAPDASALQTAELAINLKDKVLYSKDADGNVFEVSNSEEAPVTSVNSKTGAVVLTASDVGALASGDDISELNNNAGFITAADIPDAPVLSVNTKTGAVVLDASDVGALPDTTSLDFVPLGSWAALPELV